MVDGLHTDENGNSRRAEIWFVLFTKVSQVPVTVPGRQQALNKYLLGSYLLFSNLSIIKLLLKTFQVLFKCKNAYHKKVVHLE